MSDMKTARPRIPSPRTGAIFTLRMVICVYPDDIDSGPVDTDVICFVDLYICIALYIIASDELMMCAACWV